MKIGLIKCLVLLCPYVNLLLQGRRNKILPGGGTALKAYPEIFKICIYAAVKWPTVRPGTLGSCEKVCRDPQQKF